MKFQDGLINVETFPRLDIQLFSRSKMTRLRFSNWELRRYWENIVPGINPIYIDVIASRGSTVDLTVVFSDENNKLLYETAISKSVHVIGAVPISISTNHVSVHQSSGDNPQWEKSRSIWIRNIPSRLFNLDSSSEISLSNDHILWTMVSGICGDAIERMEVAPDKSDIEFISFTKDVCIRFYDFQSCRDVLNELNGGVSIGKALLVTPSCSFTDNGREKGVKVYLLKVEIDLDGYLRKRSIEHREHVREKRREQLISFQDQVRRSRCDVEMMQEKAQTQMNEWSSLCDDASSKSNISVVRVEEELKISLAENADLLSRLEKTVNRSPASVENMSEKDVVNIKKQAKELRVNIDNVSSLFRQFSALCTDCIVQRSKAVEAEAITKKIQESSIIARRAKKMNEKLQKSFDTADTLIASSLSTDRNIPSESKHIQISMEWRAKCACRISDALKSPRSLQSALRKLILKFDGLLSPTNDRTVTAIQSCMQMIDTEWGKASSLLSVWRTLVEIDEDMLFAGAAVESLLTALTSSEEPQSSTRHSSCVDILHILQDLVSKCKMQIHLFCTCAEENSMQLPSKHELDGLQGVYSIVYAVLQPLRTYLVETECLMRHTEHTLHVARSDTILKETLLGGKESTLRDALDKTEYRLGRILVLSRHMLQPTLLLLSGGHGNFIAKRDEDYVDMTAKDSVSSSGFTEEALANMCSVSGVELLMAWALIETCLMQREDEMASSNRKKSLEVRQREMDCMALEDERSGTIRNIAKLRAKEAALVHILDKRASAESFSRGKRNREPEGLDNSEVDRNDRWEMAKAVMSHFHGDEKDCVMEEDGILIKRPTWEVKESQFRLPHQGNRSASFFYRGCPSRMDEYEAEKARKMRKVRHSGRKVLTEDDKAKISIPQQKMTSLTSVIGSSVTGSSRNISEASLNITELTDKESEQSESYRKVNTLREQLLRKKLLARIQGGKAAGGVC